MKLRSAQNWIGGLWLGLTGALLAATLWLALGKFEQNALELIEWFMTHVLPTSGLVVATFAATVQSGGRRKVGQRQFVIAVALVIAYQLMAAGALVAQGQVTVAPDEALVRLERLGIMTLILAPFQGLLDLILARFFVRAVPEGEPA